MAGNRGAEEILKKAALKSRRTQSFLTGFQFGWVTEGSLGGLLAQRLAALRGKLAARARFNFTLVSRACRRLLEHVVCHEKVFLETTGD